MAEDRRTTPAAEAAGQAASLAEALKTIRIRHATPADLEILQARAVQEGWMPGRGDAFAFWHADPQGFYVAEDESLPEGERIVGSVAAVRHSPRYLFVGYFVVLQGHRERGIGHLLVDRVALPVVRAGQTTVGFDAVPQQVDRYKRWAPQSDVLYSNVRYSGPIGQSLLPPGPLLGDAGAAAWLPAADVPLDELVAYDARFSGGGPRRAALLRHWPPPGPSAHALCARRDGQICAYAAIRPTADGAAFRLGPVWADDRGLALEAVQRLCRLAGTGTAPVCIDVPDAFADGVALAKELQLAPVFSCVRMYAPGVDGFVPPVNGVYGVFSFEIGP